MIRNPTHILISRTDSIGDVILTLPLAGILKSKFPNCKISFLGKTYTQPIINCSIFIDNFFNWDKLSTLDSKKTIEKLKEQNIDAVIHVFPNKRISKICKLAQIKYRIGTSHRLYNWFTCNVKCNFTRRKSNLHESQLNVKLLSPFGIKHTFDLDELSRYAGFDKIPDFPNKKIHNWSNYSTHIILHPKSQGSAVEWGIENFNQLIKIIEKQKNIHFYITGTEKEAKYIRPFLIKSSNYTDLTGKLTLKELIALINKSDCLIACSTGPLHISGILNNKTIGLFSPKKPIHPERWKPLGLQSKTIVFNQKCTNCNKKKECNCIKKISPQTVANCIDL